AEVREHEQARDWSGAARLLDAVQATAVGLDGATACGRDYMAGRLPFAAGESSDAAAAFDRVLAAERDAGAPCALVPYAALHEAQALARLGRYDDAIACART